MKRMFCGLLTALILSCPALAESPAPSESPAQSALIVTSTPFAESPSPSPTPAGTPITLDEMRVNLPEGLLPLSDEDFAGYEAAVLSDYPAAGKTLLAAMNEDKSAAVSFSFMESAQGALDAARAAAEGILGSGDTVKEIQYGPNACAAFACAIGEQTYNLYFISNGSRLFVVGVSGLEEGQIGAMLSSLIF